jgi:hypothetical protein
MRGLYIGSEDESEDDLMVDNYRPPLPLGDRQLRFWSQEAAVTTDTSGSSLDTFEQVAITDQPGISSSFEKLDPPSVSPEPDEALDITDTATDNKDEALDITDTATDNNKDDTTNDAFDPYTFLVENKTTILAVSAIALLIPLVARCFRTEK